MKYKIQAFFSGRNGFDDLNRAILWPSLIVMLFSSFLPAGWLRSIFYYLAFFLLCYSYYRAFSRKLNERRAENARFLHWKHLQKQRWDNRKTHKYFRCPKCKQTLRVPRGKGKISITCRSCGEKFIKKT